ncbi:MAG: DUF1572 family protein [Bacteroidota bacterium]
MESKTQNYLTSITKQFQYYKMLGDRTFEQLTESELFWRPNEESNSIALIIKHLHGNMLSRWTNFLTEDGEKEWRNRDDEFEDDLGTKENILIKWEEGWNCLFTALESINEDNFEQLVYIRNMGHTITEAINRQLAHYSYHVGQITFLGKLLKGEKWQSLSIPKGKSKTYNADKFAKDRHREHFTEEFLEK